MTYFDEFGNIDYSYAEEVSSAGLDSNVLMNLSAIMATYSIVFFIIGILGIVEMWIIYKKCGKKGWEAIVPIYNMWTLFEIADLPGWLCLVPVANIIGLLVAYFKIPKKLGKSGAFGLGCLLLPIVFFGILAFSKKAAINDENSNNTNELTTPENIPTDSVLSNDNIPQVNNNQNVSQPVPDLMAESPIMTQSAPINEITPEKQFANEIPALNLEEPKEIPNQAIAETITTTPEQNISVIETTPTVNAFDMPAPAVNNQTINDIGQAPKVSNVDTKPNIEPTNLIESTPAIEQAIVNNEPTLNNIETLNETPMTQELNNDLATPQMVNEAINSDITVTKKCAICGAENTYSNKTCEKCGNVLE